MSSDSSKHACKALCKLMSTSQSFNLSTSITKEVSLRAFKPGADPKLIEGLEKMFEKDKTFDATLVALGQVKGAFLKLLKKKAAGADKKGRGTLTDSQKDCLGAFLRIKTRALTEDVVAARVLEQRNAKARKKDSLAQEVADTEVNEGGAGSMSKLAINQGRVVEDLCGVYFEGLKHGVISGDEGLVNVVVKGLTVFGSR